MQDRPAPHELVSTVAALLQNSVLPHASGRAAFEVRVAVNALELVARQLTQSEASQAAELQRLQEILGHSGSLEELNCELCERVAQGGGDDALIAHLWQTTMEKLSVDQPSYAAYRDELQRQTKT
jgi:Domain of unknown function (DUF6285)